MHFMNLSFSWPLASPSVLTGRPRLDTELHVCQTIQTASTDHFEPSWDAKRQVAAVLRQTDRRNTLIITYITQLRSFHERHFGAWNTVYRILNWFMMTEYLYCSNYKIKLPSASIQGGYAIGKKLYKSVSELRAEGRRSLLWCIVNCGCWGKTLNDLYKKFSFRVSEAYEDR